MAMTAVQFNRIGQSYCGHADSERVAKPNETFIRPRFIGPYDLSDHLLRDIGVLDGNTGRGKGNNGAFSARDLIDRYR
ncbi:hypothetical protein RNI52_11770 [Labrys neptuniae]|uniref:hypothetical protein n=1 Tax=Labrys TaxID=204476 RepID=UPI00288EB90D|nr:hypothetical protein [Labrys neptuniae]MDT3377996.1 hypothetical protein [Labrys neptuniae]